MFAVNDGIVPGVQIKTVERFLEWPTQVMHPSELYCDHIPDNHKTTEIKRMREGNVNEEENLNPDVLIFQPKRILTLIASLKSNDMIEKD